MQPAACTLRWSSRRAWRQPCTLYYATCPLYPEVELKAGLAAALYPVPPVPSVPSVPSITLCTLCTLCTQVQGGVARPEWEGLIGEDLLLQEHAAHQLGG